MFREYSEKTSIHGFQYLGEKGRTRSEKIFWIIVLALSFSWCVILINEVWKTWESNPVTVTFDDTMHDIKELWFPAVTICPSKKTTEDDRYIYDKLVDNDRNGNVNFTDDEIDRLMALAFICDDDMGLLNTRYQTMINNLGSNLTEYDLEKSILDMSQNEHFIPIFRSSKRSDPDRPYSLIMTDEGICYSYNINSDNMFHDFVNIKYIHNSNNRYETIHNATGSGYLNGVTAFFQDLDMKLDSFCNGLDHGYKVLLHSPDEFPSTRTHNLHLPFDTKADIVVEPSMFTISDDAKSLPISVRQCYLKDERRLEYFRSYNQNNCEVECLAKKTKAACRCTPFYLPHIKKYPICKSSDKKCVEEVWDSSEDTCSCLPNCESVHYKTDLYYHQMDVSSFLKTMESILNGTADADNIPEDYKVNQISVYFKESKFIPLKRVSFFGWSDFIANCGGLLGLFMGVSILSVVEIIYFWVIRLLCSVYGGIKSND